MVLTAAAKPPEEVIRLRGSTNHGNKSKLSIRVI